MAGQRTALTIGAAALGGLFCLLGVIGFISLVSGNASDFLSGPTYFAIDTVYLGLGARFLYSFVRTRSQTVWVNTLRAMSAVLLIGTGTNIHGSNYGYLE